MKYLLTDEFNKNLATLFKQGGQNKKVVDKMQSLLGHHSSRFDDDPISTFLPKTNHGETRLSNCEKFKIYDSYRLITQLSNNTRTLCFIGNHDGSESFLKKPRKTEIYVDDENRLHSLKITKSVAKFSHNVFESDLVDTRLISRLDKEDLNFVFSGLPPSSISVLGYLNTLSNDDDIINCLNDIDDLKKQNLVLDVLLELRKGDKKAAKRRINLEKGELKHLTSVETVNIKSGEDVIVLEVGSDEYSLWIEKFRESSNYFDWMLFTHPKQQEIIEDNYSGPSLLNGVSGSGKTCIIVKRAIRLAMKKPEKQILILTLNRSLSNLIHNLIEHACPKKYLDYIKVTSFFELCQELLKVYEPLDTKKFFSDVTWRHNEHIDQIWREYYRCHLNNYDALELLEIHKHFNERSIKAEKYIREEFDWIRSRFSYKERNSYLLTDRKGRAYPLLQQWRKMILNGLRHWEKKMKDVGVIDYLGLSSKLMEHYSELNILYSHVLIDEVQDFGNIELKIIRKLVDKGENDIFMAGDENQKATVKYRSFNASGINIHSSRKKEIKVNYRNSREILNAAYSIYKSNYKNIIVHDDEFNLLIPEYSNFSSQTPKLIKTDSFLNEVNSSVNFLNQMIKDESDKKACLAISGFTLRELKEFCDNYNFILLDGSKKESGLINKSNFFVSDLEQMKGFEFDYVMIINCNDNILPNPNITEEEKLTQLRLFYISMTRAKDFLGITYHNELSKWFDTSLNLFDQVSFENIGLSENNTTYKVPINLDEIDKLYDEVEDLNGLDYLYTEDSLGITYELQSRLYKHIRGKDISLDGNMVEWKDIKSAKNYLKNNIISRKYFGSSWQEFYEKFKVF